MTRSEIEAEILSIVGNRYRVQSLFRESSAAGRARYAVFTGGVNGGGHPRQITGPMSHAEAQQHRGLLMVQDILDLVDPLPEGLERIDGELRYRCRGCGESIPLDGELEDFDQASAYCGGSSRCLP